MTKPNLVTHSWFLMLLFLATPFGLTRASETMRHETRLAALAPNAESQNYDCWLYGNDREESLFKRIAEWRWSHAKAYACYLCDKNPSACQRIVCRGMDEFDTVELSRDQDCVGVVWPVPFVPRKNKPYRPDKTNNYKSERQSYDCWYYAAGSKEFLHRSASYTSREAIRYGCFQCKETVNHCATFSCRGMDEFDAFDFDLSECDGITWP